MARYKQFIVIIIWTEILILIHISPNKMTYYYKLNFSKTGEMWVNGDFC